jgi:predicted GNAT family acetyltransferase
MTIVYKRDLGDVDWAAMKALLQADAFDNGRTPEQLALSFRNSWSACVAYDGDQIVGTARVLSDGVCNAYVVDVWTLSPYRRRGIARAMLDTLLQDLHGQHVYLFTDDAVEFYARLGFTPRGVGLQKVIGTWLVNDPA